MRQDKIRIDPHSDHGAQEMSKLGEKHQRDLNELKDWQNTSADTFWGSIASKDHIIQVYEEDSIMINSMADFVIGGVNSGESSVVFLTSGHLAALDEKLIEKGFSPETLIKDKLYFQFNAEETLEKFIVDNWPDTPLLYLTISELLSTVTETGRGMRAAGEMVAILRERELIEATVQLERIWKEIYEKDPFLIFCVYPRSIFEGDIYESELSICCLHSKILAGFHNQSTEVYYRDLEKDHHNARNMRLFR